MAEPPVSTLKQAVPLLRRPFTSESVRWKVQSNLSNNRGLIVGYVDARLVAERLNAVCPDLWSEQTAPLGDRLDTGLWVCKLTIEGVTRSDVGQGQGKAGWSDALKRAAVRFGVGASIYSVPQQILDSSEQGGIKGQKMTLKRAKKGQKTVLYITPACERWLAERYSEWLESHGRKAFGEPLDHGDVAGSVGDPDETVPEPEQGDLELAAKREQAEALYAEIPAKTRPNLPPGKFRARLEAASNGQVDDLIAELTELAKVA